MPEYIKREDVQNMLDNAQIITDAEGEYFGYCTEDVDINSIPAADAVEVVRCKDCKRRPFEVRKNIFTGEPVIRCSPDDDGRCPCLSGDDYYSYIPEDDFFCAYGKRRDNNA